MGNAQMWRPPLINPGDLSNTGGAGFGTVDTITPGFADARAIMSAFGGQMVPASVSPSGFPHIDFGNPAIGLLALGAIVLYARGRLL